MGVWSMEVIEPHPLSVSHPRGKMLQAQSRKKQLWTSSIPGAYEDRTGLPKSKRKKRETVGIIEEEKQLEALVFGERELHETGCDLVRINNSIP